MTWTSRGTCSFRFRGVILSSMGCETCSFILDIPFDSTLFSLFCDPKKKTERIEEDLNIQVDGQRQNSPAELTCELPLLASPNETPAGTGEIETEVMTLFEQYRIPLLRYSISFCVPVSDAEEIVQDVFLSLFRHLRLGRSRRNLRGWIFRVTHNLTLKRRQEKGRHRDLIDNCVGLVNVSIDPSPSPEEVCSDRLRQQRLLAVVQSLSDIEQSCLRLRAEGLRYREIAGVLGISLGSVSAFLARSFAKLIRVDRG
jgi:RNA polymerase sigma-70 factor, ECF subfamily